MGNKGNNTKYMLQQQKPKFHSKLVFNSSTTASAVTRFYAKLQKNSPLSSPYTQHGIPRFCSRERTTSQKRQRNLIYDTVEKRYSNPIEPSSVLYNHPKVATRNTDKLPSIKNGPSFIRVGTSCQKSNLTNACIVDPLNDGIGRDLIIRKQKAAKEVPKKPIRVALGKIILCDNPKTQLNLVVNHLHHQQTSNRLLSEGKRANIHKNCNARCEDSEYFAVEPMHSLRGDHETDVQSPQAAHRRKFTEIAENTNGKQRLGLPTEESYVKMVGLMEDLKDFVNNEPKGSDGTQEMKLGRKFEDDYMRKDTADTGASERQTQEIEAEYYYRTSEEETTNEERSSCVSNLKPSSRKIIRPSTKVEKIREGRSSKIMWTMDARLNFVSDFPDCEIHETTQIDEVSPERERDITVRESASLESFSNHVELRKHMGVELCEGIVLMPAMPIAGEDVLKIGLAVADVKFIEPMAIPYNVYAYDK